MIRVEITRKFNHYSTVKVTGHAFAGEPGKDLVCAAVSTLAQTLANSVEEIGHIPEEAIELSIDSGYFELRLQNEDLNDIVDIIFGTFRVGIEGIERTYSKYIKLIIKEVQGKC